MKKHDWTWEMNHFFISPLIFPLNFSLIFPLIFSLIFPWIIVLRRFVSRFHLSEKTTPETLHSTPQRWWPKWARHIAPVKTTSLHLKKTGEKCEKPIAVLLKLGFYDCKGISQQSIGNVFSARNEGGFSHHPNSLSLIFFRGLGRYTTNQSPFRGILTRRSKAFPDLSWLRWGRAA